MAGKDSFVLGAEGGAISRAQAQAAGLEGPLVDGWSKGLESQGLLDSLRRCKNGIVPVGQDSLGG